MAANAEDHWSVLFIDLDGFKPINDEHGHGIGDEILNAFASRLTKAAPEGAVVARWGGDEFLVILPEADRATAAKIAVDLGEELDTPFATSTGKKVDVGWSAGIATGEPGVSDIGQVLRQADKEMLAKKGTGRDDRRTWNSRERSVARGIADDRIEVYYQPLVNIGRPHPRIIGAEALARIRVDDDTVLTPADFIDAVNDSEVGAQLDRVVMEKAVAKTAEWRQVGVVSDSFKISTNLGPASLRRPETVAAIAQALQDSQLPSEALIVEISEAAEHIDNEGLEWLADQGIEIAMDDLGVERSNIDRLLHTDATYVKLDQRWLLGERERRIGVVTTLVELVHRFGLTPIAEGVEDESDLELLTNLGVELAQGYYFSPPIPDEAFPALVEKLTKQELAVTP